MLIRVTLFLVLYLLVVKAGLEYTDAARSQVYAKEPEVLLASQEGKARDDYLKAMASYKPGDPQRCQAILQIASVCMQRFNWGDAERFFKLLQLESPPTKASNSQASAASLRLANILMAEGKAQDAKAIYLSVLSDDQKCLPKDDLRIARDLSNLGLNAYLIASVEERGDSRTEHLRQANDYYKQALQIVKLQPKTEKSMQAKSAVLANQYLALRDLNDWKGAELASNESKAILAQSKNPYSLP
jgi:hypothetical protein